MAIDKEAEAIIKDLLTKLGTLILLLAHDEAQKEGRSEIRKKDLFASLPKVMKEIEKAFIVAANIN